MAGKNTAVFGIYKTLAGADNGVNTLCSAGFLPEDVSVLAPDTETTRQFAHEKNTQAPEGATTGAVAGGIVGGAVGLLAGVGSLAIPGVGPLIAAGPIVALLAGAGTGGAVGTLIGALVGMGIPEYEAKRYEGLVKDGGILVSVHCDTSDEITRAKDLLKGSGANDVASAGEKSASTHGVESERRSDIRDRRVG
jgi:hypothetical protein